MTKKVKKTEDEKPYTELDVIMEANAKTQRIISELASTIQEKYEGMSTNVAVQTAKEYYLFGVLPLANDPTFRKEAEASVAKYFKEREERLKKKEAPSEAEL